MDLPIQHSGQLVEYVWIIRLSIAAFVAMLWLVWWCSKERKRSLNSTTKNRGPKELTFVYHDDDNTWKPRKKSALSFKDEGKGPPSEPTRYADL